MNRIFLLIAVLLAITASAQDKREFRGAWIQCVNGQFQNLGTHQMQQTLTYQLNELQKDGINAIIFQVRPECDALYDSPYEPWSRFLTGQQGRAPLPYWDPLEWMVKECHARGMELHAWINPYRAKTKTTTQLSISHIAIKKPENCFKYDDMLMLNPGIPENIDYICMVAADIVKRYDIDGIHMDDYFYPYPVAGMSIPDNFQYKVLGHKFSNINDWRRDNVNRFIKKFYETVHKVKPWVKVGISPFGIYRNKMNDTSGSNTTGLQNYDDLYADVLLWINKGWLDYCVPQLYWEIGHRQADYETLIQWWNQYAGNRPLFIGEDIERTVKYKDPYYYGVSTQQDAKHRLQMQMPNVKGTVLWYAKALVDNVGNYATNLRNNYWRYPSLMPRMPFIDSKAPKKVKKLEALWTNGDYVLFWTAPNGKSWKTKAEKFVVYRFNQFESINLENPTKIVAITSDNFYKLPFFNGQREFTYVVTALDKMHNESKMAKIKVKL